MLGVSCFLIFIGMRRTILLILLAFLLTSCGSMYQFSTINHEPEYIGDVRVDVIESRMDLNWKLRTDTQFRWDFAQYAMNQPLSWYYDNSWELGLYRTNFSAFDFYWNRSEIWWNWSFGYPYDWGWNRWNRWPYYGWSYWNDPFRFGNGWAWGYNPYRWNYGFNRKPYIYKPIPNRSRNVVVVNGRRGSNNTNITINRGRSNNNTITNNNRNRVRSYRNPDIKDKIISRKDFNDVVRDRVRTPINNNNNIRVNPNRNSNPIRVTPPVRTNPNIRSSSPPVVRPNISRGSSTSGRSSSSVIRRNN